MLENINNLIWKKSYSWKSPSFIQYTKWTKSKYQTDNYYQTIPLFVKLQKESSIEKFVRWISKRTPLELLLKLCSGTWKIFIQYKFLNKYRTYKMELPKIEIKDVLISLNHLLTILQNEYFEYDENKWVIISGAQLSTNYSKDVLKDKNILDQLIELWVAKVNNWKFYIKEIYE